ncbi:hypothetical protein J5N97_009833 [Dioscorea zingiberensis]|uniref:Midasin n=1 Tax=Dioscorea zingiberensis TaxID=325984 RepID=A0A9D5D044_9LILI|nr:hypothetical protein J5N97_009833 [Dioscorea zingiberensis]
MSLDGSFSCESALRRLLARCPALRFDPRLSSLSQKDGALMADEVVAAIADPFLHPSYTIPIMGCFRPLCRKIVERAILKLQAVPSLESESDGERNEIGEEDVHVVDFYVRRGRGLRLHELASLALVRALDLAPFLLGYLLSYYRFSPPPFRRLVSAVNSASEFKDINYLLEAVRVTYRFLVIETKVFSELWEWTCFFYLMRQPEILNFSDVKMPLDDILDIRWCSSQILSVVLKISDRAVEQFGLGQDETLLCLLRWEDFCQDITLEKAGWYLDATNAGNGNNCDGDFKFDCFLEFNNNISSIVSSRAQQFKSEGRNCRNKVSCDAQLAGGPFVLTSAIRKSFDMCLMAVSQKWPILLHGPASVGKTSLIRKLAEFCENQVLFIHVDEQMDSKTLVGSYVCTEIPGEFRWQPGSLTQAILNGCWVAFEDIDKAPNDVKSIILPVLEGSGSFVTGHGESINVPESFRLFATMTTSKHDAWLSIEGNSVWRKVMVGAPSKGDLLEIVNKCYPSLCSFSLKIIETFETVNIIASNILSGEVASTGFFNRFLLRDLLKWCRRVAGLGLNFSGPVLPPHFCRSIFQEAVDMFASSLPSLEKRLSIMRELAYIWNVPLLDSDNLCPGKPVFQTLKSSLQVGRVALECNQPVVVSHKRAFVSIRSSLQVLEKIACSVKYNEPVLLVGETGTGKTTLVQNLAMRLGHSLTVMNLSQQSDVADLLGGYKPTDARSICIPIYHELKELFCKSFSGKANETYLHRCETYVMEKNWKKLLHACQKVANFARNQVAKSFSAASGAKRKRPISEEILHNWDSFASRLDAVRRQIGSSSGMLFSFMEGAFVTAIKNGHWILLDEVNLAPPEMLQRIIGVLDGERGTICLTERGDVDCIERHPNFRIFACMNPATDAGKRELPFSFRSRFTEYFVDDVLDDEDLTLFISQYIGDSKSGGELPKRIVTFYKAAKRESEERLQDSANQKPQFSLRSLARALEYSKIAQKDFAFQKALYDGFCMFFLTLLDSPSAKIMNNMILSYLLGGNVPPNVPFDGYFTRKTQYQHVADINSFVDNYILTKSVKEHLRNLSRAIYIKRYPVLLQGPTSSGKTSLVHYLASVTGHEFVRINNHEHTDLQEYFGSYVTDSYGRLQFQEGVLVKAVRRGQWIVLDELNLAPSDVLEALNRLLDDNRELFVPELQETVPAHPEFMLFATQNPPTVYGGRKVLSRAFRNRFLEVHVDEIPEDELTMILEKRCKIPESYALKMIEVMKDLQLHRQKSKIFAGKQGFITPRDLFRWANRFRDFGKSYEDLAKDGYLLLAERLRDENEKIVVQEILERRLRVRLCMDDLYKLELGSGDCALQFPKHQEILANVGNVAWTESMWRLYFLVERCYKKREPVLLVGETGGGKTTVCQMLSAVLGSRLHILNCHQYTETSDFIGGFYPVRDRSKFTMEFKQHIDQLKHSKIYLKFSGDLVISSDISQPSTLNLLDEIVNRYQNEASLHPDITQDDLDIFEEMSLEITQLQQKWQTIFHWQDGPLVQAMKCGDLFLVDEISLADDSVLERLNSVLEPERTLSLAEKGGSKMEKITAHPNFFLLATMNPGGDYGKKELSPALRNRFTEVWVPPVRDKNELIKIASERFEKSELSCFADCMVMFWEWFNQSQTCRTLTVRDLLSWVSFINVAEESLGSQSAFIHGAFLVVLDGLSLGTGMSKSDANRLRETSLSFLLNILKEHCVDCINSSISKMENYGWGDEKHGDLSHDNGFHLKNVFGVNPFYITKGPNDCRQEGFQFLAPTTRRNALRVLRAMQLPKPVLLEGSPGVGKTSLVTALALYSGHSVVRINLSEQTDMMDLLGSDLPVEGENGMEFSWSDGILLQALKNGKWVLLDELNLAPQSVLEGLNAILDHRAEVYIPELGLTFKCSSSFRIFACQNPSCQGGGRKGLPKSFLNRFTKVYVDELIEDDYLFICQSLYPSIPETVLSKLIFFNNRLYEDTMIHRKFGHEGSPWEFNLRDIIRSCQIIEGLEVKSKFDSFLGIVYLQRMRTAADREEVIKLFEEVFGLKPSVPDIPKIYINPNLLIVGNAHVQRNHYQPTKVLKSQLNLLPGIRHSLEVALHCVQKQWLCILVGPSASGKTSLVRLLAQLTGNKLHELNLSSASDVSELLGCFEQYNYFRTFKTVLSQVERFVDEYFSLQLESNLNYLVNERREMFSKWFAFVAARNNSSSASTYKSAESWASGSYGTLDRLIEIIEQLKLDLEKYHLPVSWSYNDLDETRMTIIKLKGQKAMMPSTKFEWVPGDLMKAIECGDWVVLDNANLCNPTVLDRINSLVEPGRSIMVNECGLIDGKPVILHAHPGFRMFLTVDPKYGEVSRAMRNRGVEVFLMKPNMFLTDVGRDCMDIEKYDANRFLILSGIPSNKLVCAMSAAHLCAKALGQKLGIRITLLELSHWVQLFQQLLMTGNQLIWSLQLSWEHTYLSSLGEAEARDALMQVKISYLSDIKLDKLDPDNGFSFSLPGGWPRPHTLRNFLWYSKEASVKQNCIYLESLGAQYASYELIIHTDETSKWNKCLNVGPYVIPMHVLHHLLFPNDLDQRKFRCNELPDFNLAQANQMLFIAASWTIEQATESDLGLYKLWFKWYNSKLQPYCNFFKSFLTIIEQEVVHPIWTQIFDCWKVVCSYVERDVVQPVPLLSSKSVELVCSDLSVKQFQKSLRKAIDCVGLLRQSLKQWNDEKDYVYGDDKLQFFIVPVLESLRCLEMEVLKVIVSSSKLFVIYSNLIENHMLFWKYFTSLCFEPLFLAWNNLKKGALRLKDKFPEAVGAFLEASLKLTNLPLCTFHMEKPLLWVYGGHPFLPSSRSIFDKMHQILAVCDSIWPKKKSFTRRFKDYSVVDAVLSSKAELRNLTMQGVCMSSHLISKGSQDDDEVLYQLEELHQRLFERVEHERRSLEVALDSLGNDTALATSCCTVDNEVFCRRSVFDSWKATLSLFDRNSFLLDLILLQSLSKSSVVDDHEVYQVLASTSDLLCHALNYSLNSSSRSPVDFTPHQTILWMLDSWNSVASGRTRIASCIIEMWFNCHSSMWNYCSESLQPHIDESCHLVHTTRSATLDKILQDTVPIKDYDLHCFNLRVAARSLWQDRPLQQDLSVILFSIADSLFKQIIFVHEKSFGKDAFQEIKSLCSLPIDNGLMDGMVQSWRSLILSSSHSRLTSLVDTIMEPLLNFLYCKRSPFNSVYNLGSAWTYIGALRFHLLLNPDGPDPMIKYTIRHAELLEKISLLKLEIKVRQECERMAGRSSSSDDELKRFSLLGKLERDLKQLKAKIVYRPEPSKYMKLQSSFGDFLDLVSSCMGLTKNLKSITDLPIMIDVACNWQGTSASFIARLSEDFPEYMDIIQPIQVAVYEMKFGLAIVLSDALEREYLSKVQESNAERISGAIHSLLQFPRSLPGAESNIELHDMVPKLIAFDMYVLETNQIIDVDLLKKLIQGISPEKPVSLGQLQIMMYHIVLVHAAHSVCSSLLMDSCSFLFLKMILDHFASLWFDMKSQNKDKEENDAQYYKFRPRSVVLEDILKNDQCQLLELDSDGALTHESEEMWLEQEYSKMKQPANEGYMEEGWENVPESILNSVVLIHNQLFGHCEPDGQPVGHRITDDQRLNSFMDSYKLGTMISKDLQSLLSSTLDDNLLVEHLLYVCLKYEKTLGLPCQSNHAYNVYKDSNAAAMFKMVKPLTSIQEQARSYLDEWPDHPGLLKILDVAEMLLGMPLNTPFSKVLLGMQVLVSRVQSLQESTSRFSFHDQLQPMFALLLSWQKIELESWPALLAEVEQQHDINAGKLWFPLHSVVHRNLSCDDEDDELVMIQSVEAFMQTSNVGEFRRRLHLLLAFHQQINYGIYLKAYSSPGMKKNLDILYNAVGFYVQFLPLVLDHIEDVRKQIEKDLKEHLKLYRWEQPYHQSSMENFRRARQKTWKLIQKYNDLLQQPVMLILSHELMLKKDNVTIWLEQKTSDDIDLDLAQFPMDLLHDTSTERLSWLADWVNKAATTLQSMSNSTSGFANIVLPSAFYGSTCLDFKSKWLEGWSSIKNICRNAAEFACLLKHGTKGHKKRRAFGELLKSLERCGLSRHRSGTYELEIKPNQQNRSFMQPSYEILHLLQQEHYQSIDVSRSKSFSDTWKLAKERGSLKWEDANKYYFKNLAIMQQIQHICLKFHKDVTLEQVNRAVSFLDHLLFIQQEQRFVAYHVSKLLNQLRQQLYLLTGVSTDAYCLNEDQPFVKQMLHSSGSEGLGADNSVSPNQYVVLKCMWQQKHLFDSLLAMSKDVCLLLSKAKRCHLSGCEIVITEADAVNNLVASFIPIFEKAKESLDMYLIGHRRVVTASSVCVPFVISRQLEQLVVLNFQTINAFEESVRKLSLPESFAASVMGQLLDRFGDLISKGRKMMLDFHSVLGSNGQLIVDEDTHFLDNFAILEASFSETSEQTNSLLVDALGKVEGLSNSQPLAEKLSLQNITLWKDLFESIILNLHLEDLCDSLNRTVIAACKLANSVGHREPKVLCEIESQLKDASLSLDLILNFVEAILFEFVDAHKTIAEMTNVLAHIFAVLFSKGFGSPEESADDTACDGTQDASGTGMGEGEGINDVSDQISDEAQLLGSSEKQDGVDDSGKAASNKEKGIEMDEDFTADTFSVSEESEDDKTEDDEDINLESRMGETGVSNEVVDEKLWDEDGDDNPDTCAEKYESGPSVKETDSGSRELRAKEDDALRLDGELEELDKNEFDKLSEKDEKPDIPDGDENADSMELDKKDAFEDPTGIQVNEQEEKPEDLNMDEPQGSDKIEENDSGSFVSDEEMKDRDENPSPADHMDDETTDVKENSEVEGEKEAYNADTNLDDSSKGTLESQKFEPFLDPVKGAESAEQGTDPHGDLSMEPELHWSNSTDVNGGIAPTGSSRQNEVPKQDFSMPDTNKGSLASHQEKPPISQDESSSLQRTQPNPFRSIGDAIKEWKERVKISADLEEFESESLNVSDDEGAEEYRYVSEVEKSTSQALGSATSDQIENNVKDKKFSADEGDVGKKEDIDRIDDIKESFDSMHLKTSQPSIPRQEVGDQMLETTLASDDTPMIEENQDNTNELPDMVSFKSSYMSGGVVPSDARTSEELSKSMVVEEVADDLKQKAIMDWRKYELVTTKLSLELAEQLRLVLEPTLASKLQGDYKTGKRINMKKVIPYIASHFRKDKIWLRRTRPNKRDYQIVVAVDDSRSMSESNCGDFAVEALVTVCRAMAQLEVGQLAVVSFGEKGNIKLLHDFELPFSRETGVQMISSLSFKQDNTIADEPVFDLLKYLNNMLDAAVAKARMPSGQNPLNQLVLIIADGRFHEKESLKRRVRDLLSRRRMVAFILLDSPQESIMDLKEASFEGETLSFKRYLDSFPFPYYIVLRNIEALPRTLADLLRQWFELMQSISE